MRHLQRRQNWAGLQPIYPELSFLKNQLPKKTKTKITKYFVYQKPTKKRVQPRAFPTIPTQNQTLRHWFM